MSPARSACPTASRCRIVRRWCLLHGGPGFDHTSWADTMGPLSEWAQVVVYDHRGNGRSDARPREKWTLEQWGDDVTSFCDALDIEKPVVVGSSFGGFVAMSYAGRHPAPSLEARARLDLGEPRHQPDVPGVRPARWPGRGRSGPQVLDRPFPGEPGQLLADLPSPLQPPARRDAEDGRDGEPRADEHRGARALRHSAASRPTTSATCSPRSPVRPSCSQATTTQSLRRPAPRRSCRCSTRASCGSSATRVDTRCSARCPRSRAPFYGSSSGPEPPFAGVTSPNAAWMRSSQYGSRFA